MVMAAAAAAVVVVVVVLAVEVDVVLNVCRYHVILASVARVGGHRLLDGSHFPLPSLDRTAASGGFISTSSPQCVYFACGSARDLCLILWYAVRILQQKIFQPVFSSAQRYARVLREVLCKVMAWELTKHNTATRLKAPSSSTEARPLGFQENRGYLM